MREKGKGEEEKKKCIKHQETYTHDQNGKVSLAKNNENTYKVTVTYIQLTDEEIKIKRAIIESILKNDYKR